MVLGELRGSGGAVPADGAQLHRIDELGRRVEAAVTISKTASAPNSGVSTSSVSATAASGVVATVDPLARN